MSRLFATGLDPGPTDAVGRGVLTVRHYQADFYTSQPAPTQWVAVGVVRDTRALPSEAGKPRLLVGTGRSEQAAIYDLRCRMQSLHVTPEEIFVVDWAPAAAEVPVPV